jgi:hypothetical protein
LNSREINKIIGRIKLWKGVLSDQYALKKEDRNQWQIEDAEKRISVLKGWLKGTAVVITKDGQKGVAIEKKVVEVMNKDEFKKLANSILGAAGEPGAVMVIHDIKMLDQVYDKIKLSNIQISAPPHVLAHYRRKLKNERPYKL